MMGWLKKILGGSSTGTGKPARDVQHEEEYKGYWLSIAPQKQGGQYRVAATIHKMDDPNKVHQLIRADLLPSLDIATEQTLTKARQAVDQLGDRMFR